MFLSIRKKVFNVSRPRLTCILNYVMWLRYVIWAISASLPKGRLIVRATWGWDDWGGFPLPLSIIIRVYRLRNLSKISNATASAEFEAETFRSQGTQPTTMLNKSLTTSLFHRCCVCFSLLTNYAKAYHYANVFTAHAFGVFRETSKTEVHYET